MAEKASKVTRLSARKLAFLQNKYGVFTSPHATYGIYRSVKHALTSRHVRMARPAGNEVMRNDVWLSFRIVRGSHAFISDHVLALAIRLPSWLNGN